MRWNKSSDEHFFEVVKFFVAAFFTAQDKGIIYNLVHEVDFLYYLRPFFAWLRHSIGKIDSAHKLVILHYRVFYCILDNSTG